MRECRGVLRNDGRLYIEMPTPSTLSYPSRMRFVGKGLNVSTINFRDDATHVGTFDLRSLQGLLQSHGFTTLEAGIIENKYLEDLLLAFGVKYHYEDFVTFAVWSKLRWAQYVIGEKVSRAEPR